MWQWLILIALVPCGLHLTQELIKGHKDYLGSYGYNHSLERSSDSLFLLLCYGSFISEDHVSEALGCILSI